MGFGGARAVRDFASGSRVMVYGETRSNNGPVHSLESIFLLLFIGIFGLTSDNQIIILDSVKKF